MTCRIVTIGDLTADLIMPVQMPIEAGTSQEMPWHSVEPGGAGNFLIAGQRLGPTRRRNPGERCRREGHEACHGPIHAHPR